MYKNIPNSQKFESKNQKVEGDPLNLLEGSRRNRYGKQTIWSTYG